MEADEGSVVDRVRKRQVMVNMGERFTEDFLVAITLDERGVLLAVVKAAQKVVDRGEERLIGTRIYTVPWADVHTLRETLAAALTTKVQT